MLQTIEVRGNCHKPLQSPKVALLLLAAAAARCFRWSTPLPGRLVAAPLFGPSSSSRSRLRAERWSWPMRRWVAFPSRLPVVVVGAMPMPSRVTPAVYSSNARPIRNDTAAARPPFTVMSAPEAATLLCAALDGPEEEDGREKRARAEQDADAGRATAA